MASFLTTLLACPLALLSIYAGQKSYHAIMNLHSDQDRAEKAAEHSNKAARELWRIRLTQAGGAATVRSYDQSEVNCFASGTFIGLPQHSRLRKSPIVIFDLGEVFSWYAPCSTLSPYCVTMRKSVLSCGTSDLLCRYSCRSLAPSHLSF